MTNRNRFLAFCILALPSILLARPALGGSFEGTWEQRDPGPFNCTFLWPDGRRVPVELAREPLLLAADAQIGEFAENVSGFFGGGTFAGGISTKAPKGSHLAGGTLQPCSAKTGASTMVLRRGRVFPQNRKGISGKMVAEVRGFDFVQTVCTIRLVRTDATPPSIPTERCPLN